MTTSLKLITQFTAIGIALAFTGRAVSQQAMQMAGAPCPTSAILHCPDKDCLTQTVINQGPVVEMKTRRTYFLDYPCDLRPGEKVTFILSLHGFGSYGNWQRHYFPVLDYVDKYRLVVATPNSPTRSWSAYDDEYLQNIVTSVVEQIGKENIKAFWLAGHSQGGLTSNRIVRTDFFKDRVDGWLSLSGGRLGGNPGRSPNWGPPRTAAPSAPSSTPTAPTGVSASASRTAPTPSEISATMAALREPPTADFSFIYETGQREMDDKGLPETSDWAKKYGCGPRQKRDDIVDTKPGYVYDSTRQNPPNPSWGLLPAPGRSQVYVYPDCKQGRVVADIVRLDKGHTEGLEPKITEELIKLMLSAKGGKMQQARQEGR